MEWLHLNSSSFLMLSQCSDPQPGDGPLLCSVGSLGDLSVLEVPAGKNFDSAHLGVPVNYLFLVQFHQDGCQ